MSPRPASYSGRRDLLVTLAALAAVLAWDFLGLDLASARLFGSAKGFAYTQHFLFSRVAHDAGRLLAWLVLGVQVCLALRPPTVGPTGALRWRWIGVTLGVVLAVPALKRISATSCPWDLAEFGGAAQYISHWQWGLADGGGGHCFPSGHAVAAFAFFSLYFLWRGVDAKRAHLRLAGVLLLGTLFGAAQLARGAHYPSHTLWSAWLCWALCAAAAALPALRTLPSKPS